MRKSVALSLLMVFFTANAFAAAAARLTGKVTDAATKKPIEGAKVTVTAVEGKTFNQEVAVKPKDGSYAIYLLDGTIRYKFVYSAPGYAPFEEVAKLKIGEPNVRDIALAPGNAAASTVSIPAAEIKVDPSVAAFNEGASLANAGDDAGAVKKFEEAVAAKPDLIAGWSALAKIRLRMKNHKGAIEAANKVLEIDNEDAEMYAILYDAYTATGDKVKAAEAKKKMPANAGILFNDAAKAINANKDSEAEGLLKQAIAADPKFAQAYYELGMLYARAQKNADARTNLEKYLELDPNGRDVATAKEMLKYVK